MAWCCYLHEIGRQVGDKVIRGVEHTTERGEQLPRAHGAVPVCVCVYVRGAEAECASQEGTGVGRWKCALGRVLHRLLDDLAVELVAECTQRTAVGDTSEEDLLQRIKVSFAIDEPSDHCGRKSKLSKGQRKTTEGQSVPYS